MDELKVIGRAEPVSFPEIDFNFIPARIDTGAKTSSINISESKIEDGKLKVVFLNTASDNRQTAEHEFDEFEEVIVASSNGHKQKRHKVRLLVELSGIKIKAWFTLADRSTQVYPVLIGRNVLSGKFMVNVKVGNALRKKERERSEQIQSWKGDNK